MKSNKNYKSMQLQKSVFMASVDLTVCEHPSIALLSLTGNLPRREAGECLVLLKPHRQLSHNLWFKGHDCLTPFPVFICNSVLWHFFLSCSLFSFGSGWDVLLKLSS